jgi:hypothetical protein
MMEPLQWFEKKLSSRIFDFLNWIEIQNIFKKYFLKLNINKII